MGNLGSICKALEHVGGEVVLTSDPECVMAADKIVLPGVGAFGEGIENLRERGLLTVLAGEVKEKKKPFLGICLGMQLLAKKSFEFGEHEGLGWIDAEVTKLALPAPLKVPHVGWNSVSFIREHPILAGMKSGADFYFVHSYHMICKDPTVILGTVDYGSPMVAMIVKDNIVATQFHPEKSQQDGLQLLKNFITWQP